MIAGVHKAATTSLFEYLAQHPDICTAPTKTEARYFSSLRRSEGTLEDPASYAEAHFAHCGSRRYVMEASSNYLFGGTRMADAIRDALEEPKVVISLRDPVERMWSFYNYMKSMFLVPVNMRFEEYIERSRSIGDQGLDDLYENRAYAALSSGEYERYLAYWLETFGSDLKIVFFEEIVADARAVMKALVTWLDLDPSPVDTFDLTPANPTVLLRSRALRRVADALSRAGRKSISKPTRVRLARIYTRLNSKPRLEKLKSDTRAQLKGHFAPANARLKELLMANGYSALPEWLSSASSR